METLFLYLLKSGALIAVFWAAYVLLLRGETFFKTNRWFLLAGLLASLVLPAITFTKVILVDPSPAYQWDSIPVGSVPGEISVDWWIVAAAAYVLGLLGLLTRFCIDFLSLRRTLSGKTVMRQADFKLVDTAENIAPFSYFNYIVYNSGLYSKAELENILAHEKVHSEQMHSVDVLLMRGFCIAFWFNPFVWLYKKAVLQNLEFIADSEAIKNIIDKKSYQITLLKVTAHETGAAISNHFFQSLIKKRIVMLNKNQSQKWQSWKYALVVPALAAFMLYFQVEVIAQEKQQIENKTVQGGFRIVVDKNTTDAELKSEAANLKKEHGVTIRFTKVKRNKSGEIIGIKAEFKDASGKKGVTHISSDEPIKPISIYKNDDGEIGFGQGRESRIWNSDRGNDEVIVSIMEDFEAPEAPDAPGIPDHDAPPRPDSPPHVNGHNKHVVITSKDGKTTVIADGKVLTGEEAERIAADLKPLEGTYAYSSSGGNVYINKEEIKRISRDAMMRAQEELDRIRPEMDRAQEEIRRIQPEMERARIEMRRAEGEERISKAEMERAKKEIEMAREEIVKAKAEIEKARAEMQKAKSDRK